MSQGNTLTVVNHFQQDLDVVVSTEGFNCCDAPRPGQVIGLLHPGNSTGFMYVRTDGHGCDGNQGQFTLSLNSIHALTLNFDSNGVISPFDPPHGFGAWLVTNSDGSFTLIVSESATDVRKGRSHGAGKHR